MKWAVDFTACFFDLPPYKIIKKRYIITVQKQKKVDGV